MHDRPAETHRPSIPTRLGRLHVRTIGDGAPTVLWSSMFVDSHTWDPVVPLLPTGSPLRAGRPARAGPQRAPAPRERHRRRRRRGHRPARRARHRRPGRLARQRLRRARRAQARHATRRAAQPRGRQLTDRADRPRAAPADPPAAARSCGPRGRSAPCARRSSRAMLTDASAADDATRRVVVESLARPTRRSMALAVRSFILDRVDVTAELADLAVPSLFVASDDRGDWSPAGRRGGRRPRTRRRARDGHGRPHPGPPRAAAGPGLPHPPVLGPAGLSAHAARRTPRADAGGPRADVPSCPCGAPSSTRVDRSSPPPASAPAPASTRTPRPWGRRPARPRPGRPWASSAPPSTRSGWWGRCPAWPRLPAATATWWWTSRGGGRPRSPGRPLRGYLRALGYDARGWGFGTNLGDPRRDVDRLAARVLDLVDQEGCGRVAGRVEPGRRHRPRGGPPPSRRGTTGHHLRHAGGRRTGPHHHRARPGAGSGTRRVTRRLDAAAPIRVPLTAVFSKRDGIVSWQACIDRSTPGVEHVEVSSTHIGMGVDPDVWAIVADRLSRDPA